jgi:hypothetical protein
MEKTAMMELIDMLDQHISKHKDYANKFDTGAMVAKNFAMSLLDKEKEQMEKTWVAGLYCETGDRQAFIDYYNENYKSEQ